MKKNVFEGLLDALSDVASAARKKMEQIGKALKGCQVMIEALEPVGKAINETRIEIDTEEAARLLSKMAEPMQAVKAPEKSIAEPGKTFYEWAKARAKQIRQEERQSANGWRRMHGLPLVRRRAGKRRRRAGKGKR